VKVELLRRFLVLAEELNFTRAAQRLHVSQQVLSTQIKDLEREIGAQLFDRTTHRVQLTPAGQELRSTVQSALATLDAGIGRTRQAAGIPMDVLRVGFVAQGGGSLQAPLIREFRRRHPHVSVEIRSFPFSDPFAGLVSGESDVAFLRNPLPHPGIALEHLSDESRVVMAPRDHPLARLTVLRPENLIGHPAIVVRGHATDPDVREWTAEHTLEALIGSRPVGAVVETAEDWLQAAEDGRGLTTTPVSAMEYYPRPGIIGVPITGVTPLTVMVGWRHELSGNAMIREIVSLAHDAVRARPAGSPGC
jgi:DNA-binding transcriptional LysR family regulator